MSAAGEAAFDPLAVPLAGRHLIEASAGTGKTFTLALLYVRLVLEARLEVSSILVVTFTNAATAELIERIRKRLRQTLAALRGEDDPGRRDPPLARLVASRVQSGDVEGDCRRLRLALGCFDEAAISTIHGFCLRALSEHSFDTRTDPDAAFVKDDASIYAEVADDFHQTTLETCSPRLYAALRKIAGGLLPPYLSRLASDVAGAAELALLPEAAEEGSLAPFESAFERAFESARERFPGVDALVAQLGSARLNRNSYPLAKLGHRAERVARLLSAPPPATLDGGSLKLLEPLTTRALAARTNKGGVTPAGEFFEAVEGLVDSHHALIEAARVEAVQTLRRFCDYAREQVPLRKAKAKSRSYADLLTAMADAVRGDDSGRLVAALRESYGAALVDEFQDTDPVQYAIFDRIFGDGERPLFLIGDPKQAIYGFRGADIFAYLRAAAEPAVSRHTLTTCWRSDPGVLDALATLFAAPRPFVDSRIRFVDVSPRPGVRPKLAGPALRFLWLSPAAAGAEEGKKISGGDLGRALPRRVAVHVQRLLEREPQLSPPDVAVLTRTNLLALRVQEALLELGVPAVVETDASVLDSVEAEEIEVLLRAILSPSAAPLVRTALATGLVGKRAPELLALGADERRWDALVARLSELRTLWFERGTPALATALLATFDVAERLLAQPRGERRLTNVLHLFELLGTLALEGRLSPSALVARLGALRLDPSRRNAELVSSSELRLETDAHAVRCATLHKSKGLEYPVVYLPDSFELGAPGGRSTPTGVRFHDPERGDRASFDLGSPALEAHRQQARLEAFAEGMRLFYVGLTRAKHRIYCVWGPTKKLPQSAPGWLLHGARRVEGAALDTEAMETVVDALDQDALRRDLEVLSRHRAIALEDIDAPRRGPGQQLSLPEPPPALRCRGTRPHPAARYRVASFSSLKATAEDVPSDHVDLLDGRDRDQESAPDPVDPSRAAEEPVALADFPAGTGPGHVVHEVFERYDFVHPDRTPLEAICRQVLESRGFDADLTPALHRGMLAALDTPMGSEGEPTLHGVDAFVPELEFFLSAPARPGLDPARLADVFRRHAAPHGDAGYADSLERLRFARLRGYLHGFVDLLFRARGRYYVVDYKTNHLGPRASDYAPSSLEVPMAHHHYHLQYHLYTVAVARTLRQRLPDFDYERDFGGVRYLFVRGMAPWHPPGTGVYVDRPTEALIRDLDDLLTAGGEGA